MNTTTLTEAGLTPEQAEIYTSLLENGPQSAATIAKTTSVKRTYVYRICQELAKLSLATTHTKANTTYFAPLSPTILLSHIEAKKASISAAHQALLGTLPQLESMFRLIDTKPVISHFTGIEGIIHIFRDIIKEGQDILLFRSIYDESNTELGNAVNQLIADQIKNHIHTHVITPLVPGAKDNFLHHDKERLVARHLTRNKNFLLPSQMIIYGQKVALISLKSSLSATLIENKDISQTFRQLFQLLWSLTEPEHLQIVSGWEK